MALDYAFLNILCRELGDELKLARIEKIYMPSRDEAVFNLHAASGPRRLFISARSGAARLHLTQEEFDNPAVPANFCMLLRKYLGRGRIEGIRSVPGERVMLIDFSSVAETGELMSLTLSVEMMGRYSNMVLVRDGVVVDALKRISFDKSEIRQLIPQVKFTLPPPQDKLNIATESPKDIALAAAKAGEPLSQALLRVISGISPVVCREIAFRAVGAADTDSALLSGAELEKTAAVIAEVQSAIAGENARLCAVYDGARAVDFSFISLTQYGGCEERVFDSASALLCDYYGERDRQERQKNRSRDLLKQANKLYEKAKHKHEARLKDQKDTAAAEQKKLYGELITANLHAIEKGAVSAQVLNYYTGETITIPLDRRISAGANAQKYYKEYRKLITAQTMLEKLLQQDEEEMTYLSSVVYAASRAQTEAEFDAIRHELKSAGYLKNFKEKEPRKQQKKKDVFIEYRTRDDFRVLCGRNNLQNERLTFKTADRRDLWFHVKNYPGSHTVLFTDGRAPSAEAIADAACIAACNSSATAAVSVDYTEVRNVKKQQGARPGMVIYLNFKSVSAEVDTARAAAMLVGTK